MAVLVVFFPAYVMLAQGFALVPRAARELVQVYGGSKSRELALVSVPYAASYLFAAAKLVAPRALLGVMVAEWLLSGRGLGNLLNSSRGLLDYDMVWAGAVVSILISVAAYEAVGGIERPLARCVSWLQVREKKCGIRRSPRTASRQLRARIAIDPRRRPPGGRRLRANFRRS